MGKILIISGPMGSGKNTVIDYILKSYPSLFTKVVTATTRPPRSHEVNGIDKYFMSSAEFEELRNDDGFIETEEVNPGIWYGTPYFAIEAVAESDKMGIMDIDVLGAMRVKQKLDDKVVLIFLRTTEINEIERRLRARNTESEEMIQMRLNRIDFELSYESKYEYVIINDELEETKQKIDSVIQTIQEQVYESTADKKTR